MKISELKKVSMRDTFSTALLEISQSDEKVYVLDGDLATSTKIDTVATKLPEKFLQMGIAEQNMLSVAAGLATTGLQPWVATFAAFMSKRALDQIQVQIAQPNLDVKMIGAYSGLLTGLTGKSHQALEDIAIFRTLANMTVLAPADAVETAAMIKWANEYNGPVYIRLARDNYPVIFDEQHQFEVGKGVQLREGTDLTIIATGTQTSRALEAAEILAEQNISAAVLHLPSIKPIDQEAIIQAAVRTGAIVTAEEHSIYGGLGSAVAEILAANEPTPIEFVGVKDRNSESADNDELLNKHELLPIHVAEAAKRVLARKR
ncbi:MULTISPECIES: transketolase family protein [Bacillales]|uniref:Transketolase family protein n=1 Tax=Lysinibacillus louembei TaxID=1470088 RepID=A0ABZ0S0X1_9BACI|nr:MULTISPECIES: transketolase family protein [Bacillales]MCT6924486.1 transketolase family protein [Metasolibacillus sp.]MCT6940689.1 transketolase family protein [Metasolibacillus sp.]WPK12833.1 transketolase family protein [Lysinibacillus louembei]